jgi:hypothetical protein
MQKGHLQRMFRYPVPCYECFDGPGHLISHLLSGHQLHVTQDVTLFGKIPLKGRYMRVLFIMLSTLSGDETFTLAGYFPKVDEYILQTLEEDIHEIARSQYLLFVMIWNTLANTAWWSPKEIGGIVVGVRKALRLPYDSKATFILGPLSMKLLRIGKDLARGAYGGLAERELVKREITITSQLLLANLASRSIFGRLNSHQISCAQAVGDAPPALGWLPPYDW